MTIKIFISALVVACLFACKPQTKKTFEVTGSVRNTAAGMVYLEETPVANAQRLVADSSVINKDGSYHLKATVTDESLFSLVLQNETIPFAYVINDVSGVVVNADAKNPNDYEVKGSAASKSLKEFSIAASEKWTRLYWVGREMDSLKKSGASDSLLADCNEKGNGLLKDLQGYVSSFIKNSQDPLTSIWALGSYSQVFSGPDYQALLNTVVERFPNNKGIAAIKEMNDRQMVESKKQTEESTSAAWVNKQAPELSLPDVNGKQIKLSSFKGKYVLVDFWASWCGPCRRENPNVVEAFKKYKDKNFTILGVSLDSEKDNWVEAIRQDELDWTQVSDLHEWNSIAVSTFNLSEIPFNVLVDPNGKIIAQSLRGPELDTMLEAVLK